MVRRFRSENQKLRWNRMVSCAVLGVYLLAFVLLPTVHGYICTNTAKTSCQQSHSAPLQEPVSGDSCPICEFAHLIIPFFTVAEPLLWQPDTVAEVCFTTPIPPVVYAAALPPCRAPPIL
jgi:hypothetical protein